MTAKGFLYGATTTENQQENEPWNDETNVGEEMEQQKEAGAKWGYLVCGNEVGGIGTGWERSH